MAVFLRNPKEARQHARGDFHRYRRYPVEHFAPGKRVERNDLELPWVQVEGSRKIVHGVRAELGEQPEKLTLSAIVMISAMKPITTKIIEAVLLLVIVIIIVINS